MLNQYHFWSKEFYDHRGRWHHYFNQILAVRQAMRKFVNSGQAPETFTLLEVGPGIGTVASYLKGNNVAVQTLSIAKQDQPDLLGSITNIPLPNKSFEMGLVCEVFEHLPYEDFQRALAEMRRVVKGNIFISVPDHRHILFKFSLKIPFLKELRWCLRVNRFRKRRAKVSKDWHKDGHYWELGYPGFRLSKIITDIQDSGLNIVRHWSPPENTKNHYFLLQSK